MRYCGNLAGQSSWIATLERLSLVYSAAHVKIFYVAHHLSLYITVHFTKCSFFIAKFKSSYRNSQACL
jgi:hypothetical protein